MIFGRKKKQDQADAIMDAVLKATGEEDLTADPGAPEAAGPAKEKKKDSSGQNKSKPVSDNLLIVHAEKIALVTAVLLAGYLIYAGLNSGTDAAGSRFNKTKEQLESIINTAKGKIQNGDWEREKQVYAEGLKSTYEQRAANSEVQIAPSDYFMGQLFNPPINRSSKKREDPELYAPTALRAVAVTGSVAYLLAKNEVDPTAADEPAKPKEVKKKPAPTPPKRGNDDPGGLFDELDSGEMDMGMGMGGEMGMGGGLEEGGGSKPIRRLRSDRGQILGYRPTGGTSMGMDMGMGMGDMGMGMDAGMESGSSNGQSAGSSGSTDRGPKGTPIARSRTMVAVTALVPFKKQFDEYERALAMRSGYDSRRDQPNYVFMYVQRVDVTPDPTQVVEENQWQRVLHTNSWRTEEEKWHGTAKEIVDPSYLNPYISLSCPPLMMRNLEDLLRHPEIPLAGTSNDKATTTEPTETEENSTDDNDNVDRDLPGGIAGRRPATGSTDAGTDNDYGNMPGMGMGMGDMGMGDMGMGDMGMGMGGGMLSANIPDYKLVRFFDFGAEPGHVYRYRVQLLIEDPNHPNSNPADEYRDHLAPSQQTLETSVLQRIKVLEGKVFYRPTEWSEPSEPISVLSPLQFAGGSVEPFKLSRDSTGKTYEDIEPAGLVKTIIWDKRRAVDIPFDRPVHRGSILNFTADAEYGHPLTEVIMAASGQPFKTDYIVGDIRGGDELPLHSRDFLYYAPGEFLLIDAQGNLIVHSELDDHSLFRRFDYTAPAPAKDQTGTGYGSATAAREDSE